MMGMREGISKSRLLLRASWGACQCSRRTKGTIAFVLMCLLLSCASVQAGAEAPEPLTITEQYERVHEAVVLIETVESELADDPSLGFVASEGQGSGVLISADGMVLTASHVVQAAEEIVVVFENGERRAATVVRSAPAADLALLKLQDPPPDAKFVKLGDSNEVRPGQRIFVVGAPFGIDHTLTVGYVSARRRPDFLINGLFVGELVQTDAAINPGNSGGPMFNMNGEVIGIVSHSITHTGSDDGVGFAVASNTVHEALLSASVAWSGLDAVPVFDEVAAALNIPQAGGLLVQRVVPKSPAAMIGIRGGRLRARIDERDFILGGDVILAVRGVAITSLEALTKLRAELAAAPSGERIEIQVLRGGKKTTLGFLKP